MPVKFCPKCKSEKVEMVAGGVAGLWECKKCGYMASLFPEINIEKMKKSKEKKKSKKQKNDK